MLPLQRARRDRTIFAAAAPVLPFISTWDTTKAGSANTTIVIPTIATGTYDCVVDWGDGTTSTITTYNDPAWTHVYGASGVYNVSITGTFRGIRFNNGGDCLKLMVISQWGILRLGTTEANYFFGCANLTVTATDNLDLTGTTNLSSTFRSCTSLTTVPSMNSWNLSAVTNIQTMFSGATSFNQNISSWNTGNVTQMNSTFQNTAFNQDISGWNTGSVTLMSNMFNGASAFNQNISGWNTASVTNMASMFQNATAFNQDISGWNTGNVTNMGALFSGASAFNQNLGAWNITKVTGASDMFLNTSLTKANYNPILIGWAAQSTPRTNVVFSGGTAHYDGAAVAARAVLTGTYTWTITDGGTP